MILDLHNHSIKSDDARAKVQNYCQWIAKRKLAIDGFVLTEHRQYDAESDYRAIEDEFGILILKASEVETDYGHVLVFGVNEDMTKAFDFSKIGHSCQMVVDVAKRCGGIAMPCHPGRAKVGMLAHVEERGPVDGVEVIEVLNGGSRGEENQKALVLAERLGCRRAGGSDAHIVSHIGRCATKFENQITCMTDLVDTLRTGEYEAIQWE